MRGKLGAITLIAVVAMAGLALAHEGHEHKILGKVVTIDEKAITVEGLDASGTSTTQESKK